MLNDKELSILNSIAELHRPAHIDELATTHTLSPRSIRSYIARINKDLGFECIALKKGFYQVTDHDFLENFLEDSFGNSKVSNYSGQVLVVFMLHKLAVQNKINLTHFVTEFEVSRTTAKNYLNQVKEQLEEYHLKLDHSGAIVLLGTEEAKRQLILNLLLHLGQRSRIELELISPLLQSYINKETTSILQQIIRQILLALDYTLSEHSHQILLSYLSIACARSCQGFPLTEVVNRQFFRESEEFKTAQPYFRKLEEQLGISFPVEESLEVINKVMGLHYSKNKESEQLNWFEYDLFISKLIRRFSKEYGANLVGDFQLYENLLNHIKPAMYRIAHNIRLHQFDHAYIVEQSKKEYEITTEILKQLHFFPSDDVSLYRDEIALICVYFKQAVEKLKTEVMQNVLLVSRYGYGSSAMLIEKIQKLYQVGEIKWIPTQELHQIDLSQFHLLITTEPLESPLEHFSEQTTAHFSALPVVEITPFFQHEDRLKLAKHLSLRELEKINLSQVLEIIQRHCTTDNLRQLSADLAEECASVLYDDSMTQHSILQFIEEETILLDFHADTVNEVLEKAGELLEKNGYILPSYSANLIESFENYGVYMMIDEDVAIPHTKNKNNVLKTGFSFIRLKEPIHFDGHSLSMFFTFCTVNNKEHLEALVLIADIIKNDQMKKSIQELDSGEDILDFLQRYELSGVGED